MYSNAGEQVRVDYFHFVEAKVPYLTKIFSRQADRLIMIYPERKAYTESPIGNAGNPGMFFRENSIFRRSGNSKIANAPCTEWGVEVPGTVERGDTACVTDDGIPLRIASANPAFVTLTAIDIRYGSSPEGYFDPPSDSATKPRPNGPHVTVNVLGFVRLSYPAFSSPVGMGAETEAEWREVRPADLPCQ